MTLPQSLSSEFRVAWIWAEVGEGKKEEECCGGKNEFKAKSLPESTLSWDCLCEKTGK